MIPFALKPVIILTGGLGSGKTELASNLAFAISSETGETVHVVDLDNVKPFFKIRDLDEKYRTSGVRIVAPPGLYANADLPVLPPEARSLIERGGGTVILDIAGDESGARVLGGYRDEIEKRDRHFFFVLNISRPYPRDVEGILEMARGIEAASGLKITGLVNNTHMLWHTEEDTVRLGHERALEVSRLMGVPLVFSAVKKDLDIKGFQEPVFKMDLYFYNRLQQLQ